VVQFMQWMVQRNEAHEAHNSRYDDARPAVLLRCCVWRPARRRPPCICRALAAAVPPYTDRAADIAYRVRQSSTARRDGKDKASVLCGAVFAAASPSQHALVATTTGLRSWLQSS